MSSNAGSAATFTGNPQNKLIQGSAGMSYARFAGAMILPALLSTLAVVAVLLFAFRKQLPRSRIRPKLPPPPVDRRLLALSTFVLAGVVAAFFAGSLDQRAADRVLGPEHGSLYCDQRDEKFANHPDTFSRDLGEAAQAPRIHIGLRCRT